MSLAVKKNVENMSMPNLNDWSEIYQHVWIENNKALDNYINTVNLEGLHKNWHRPLTIFDPEIIADTYQQAFGAWMDNPENLQRLQVEYYGSLQSVLEKYLTNSNEIESKEVANQIVKDKRFRDEAWDDNPFFRLMKELYLLSSDYAEKVVDDNMNLDAPTAQKLKFYTKQLMSMMAPSNFPTTNPVVLNETVQTKGENLITGFQNYINDLSSGKSFIQMSKVGEFELGKNIAATPGKVVFQNDLIQLIQYSPTTEKVAKRPLLIIPPWINKYYVFDLSQENSFIRWALDIGHTVFMVSWVNPDERYANMTLTNYVIDGVLAASDAVQNITDEKFMNVMGYCTGGVALTCLLSYLADHQDERFTSATIIAAPIDYSHAGDLLVYVCDKQLKKLEAHVKEQGYLDGSAMVASFNLLRSNDLIWSFYVNNYLLGKEPMPFDMLHWNCDSVRMPAKMHLDFLRSMYLENKLIKPGEIIIDNYGVDLAKIKTPMYVMAAVDDHIAPWQSVYPLTQKVSGPIKFALGASGHVAGVFNSVHKNKYNYWVSKDECYIAKSASQWLDTADQHAGSWWRSWQTWVDGFASSHVKPRKINQGFVIESAPGHYALTPA